jgi:hypothetical protein
MRVVAAKAGKHNSKSFDYSRPLHSEHSDYGLPLSGERRLNVATGRPSRAPHSDQEPS